MTLTDDGIEEPRTSRRALFGLGAALVAGAVTAADVARQDDAAEAAPQVHHGRQYATPSAAAAAVGLARSRVFPHDPTAHLLRRATFGPRPGDVRDLHRMGIDRWLERQLSPGSIPDARGATAAKRYPLEGAKPATIIKRTKRYSWDAMIATTQAALARQVFSDRQLFEVVVDVFANHLHVPIPGEQWHTSPSYIRDVIRRYAFGSFEEMLLAAMRHPAMLNFLSNDESKKANVNENLGRELLELHTVGLAAKYTEQDVRASARILSGRTWDYETGRYQFDSLNHATGRVKVLGFTHPNRTGVGGQAVGDAYLRYLARHPATARTIARKLAIRFVSDTPSPDLVNRLAHVYLSHDTNIKAVVAAVFRSSDFWSSVGDRMRRPLEDAVGAMRVLDVKTAPKVTDTVAALYWNLSEAGHTPHGWLPPNGTPDVAAAWLGAGAMLQRWNLHRAVVYGWWKGAAYTPPSRLVDGPRSMSTAEWTRRLAKRLLGVQPSPAHLRAAISGAGLKPSDPAPFDDWRCGKVAALLLDSAYFQLR